MRFESATLDGVVVIALDIHTDDRGGFARTFCVEEFGAHGLPTDFPQSNLSVNDKRGTLRGLHFNVEPFGESKLVRCVRGAIHDVVVDLRPDSSTRFEHVAIELSAENRLALFVPAGFAHGFVTLEDTTDVYYHMGSSYVPSAARGIRWDDPTLMIDWPVTPTIMSPADSAYPNLDPGSLDIGSIPA
jgi:dTDP-4-dehydrorhamnose 3,5-epimerase